MCGIVGAFNLHDDPTSPSEGVRGAMERLVRRGPDEGGLFLGHGVALGHRRLSVIDPAGGAQPWIDRATGVVIVFNGEIYNHGDLRHTLSRKGHRFRTRSDTEVLCRAFLEWGYDCVDRLTGMFAFAAWDPRDHGLFLARDRLGVKPLHYSVSNSRFGFGSTVSAIRSLPFVGGCLDLDAVSHYLTTVRTTLGEQTLLADVKTLLPGHAMVVRRRPGTIRRWRYWEIPIVPAAEKRPRDLDEASEELRELLERSVTDRLVSDVPVGSFLSGGIDSAVIASVAIRGVSEPLTTFTVGFAREGYNEWPSARATASHLGVVNREIHLEEEDYLQVWASLMKEKGVPLSTPNEVGIFHLATALRSECTVALTGEGADEVLGGYTIPHFSALDFDRSQAGPDGDLGEALKRLYGTDRLGSRQEHFFHLNSWITKPAKSALLSGDANRAVGDDETLSREYASYFAELTDCSTMDAYLHVHARVNLEGLLSRVDSSTMAASVEARVPFTDHRVVEFAFRQPDCLKLDWRSEEARATGVSMNIFEVDGADLIASKRMLRRAFRADLPASVVDRRKMSFPTPFLESFGGSLKGTVDEVLEESPLIGPLLDRDGVRALSESGSLALWPVVNLCLWSLVGDPPEI